MFSWVMCRLVSLLWLQSKSWWVTQWESSLRRRSNSSLTGLKWNLHLHDIKSWHDTFRSHWVTSVRLVLSHVKCHWLIARGGYFSVTRPVKSQQTWRTGRWCYVRCLLTPSYRSRWVSSHVEFKVWFFPTFLMVSPGSSGPLSLSSGSEVTIRLEVLAAFHSALKGAECF